jgi:hypothetical protein
LINQDPALSGQLATEIVALALEARIPTTHANPLRVEVGGVLSYGPDPLDYYLEMVSRDSRNPHSAGVLAGRKESTRKLYRDAYQAFRRFLQDVGVDPARDGWKHLPPDALAAF